MQKTIATLLLCLACSFCLAQIPRPVSLYLSTQYNKTLYDATNGNNPWSIGLGLQAFVNISKKFKPTVELTGDAYLMNDKVLRFDSTGRSLNNIDGMVNLFAGLSFNPVKPVYISVLGGPSFLGGQTRFGIKPSVGFYFPGSKKWTAKISYINIFNRGESLKQDFGSLSIAVGFRLF
jgi:hypothetical protein